MKRLIWRRMTALFAGFTLIPALVLGCGVGQREETVAGVEIPIPGGMTRVPEQRVELSLPGFGGGQTSYQGSVDPDRIIEFYKKEMPARGWKFNASLVIRGGILAYTKEGKSVLISVSGNNSGTSLTLTIGTAGS